MKDGLPVTDLLKGERARVQAVRADSGVHLRKLAAFGVLPGVDIEVLQTSPAYVLKVNHTQIALDYMIASQIIVQKN